MAVCLVVFLLLRSTDSVDEAAANSDITWCHS